MGYKLKCTDRVCNAFEIVALSVGKVIHWVRVPFRSCAMMWRMYDAIYYWVAEVHIRICHIELCTKYHRTLHSLGSIHLFKQTEVFLYRTVTIWRGRTRFCRRTFLLGNLFACLLVNIRLAFLYHPYCEVPQLLEVVRGIVYISPFEAEPTYVVKDILYIFVVFLCRVGVVKAQIAHSVIFLCNAEIHADSLSVSDV